MLGWVKDQRAEANKLRKNGDLTDVCFQPHKGNRVRAHKIYLCTFNWRYSTRLKNESEIKLELVDDKPIEKDEMEQIIDFIYTANFDFTNYSFREIIRFHSISSFLMINYLTEQLLNYIMNNFEKNFSENALYTWRYFRGKENENEVLKAIVKNVEPFLGHSNVRLDRKEYLDLLNHKNNRLNGENKCKFILEWVEYDEQNRRWDIADLLKTINFLCLEEDTIQKLMRCDNEFIKNKIIERMESKKKLVPKEWDSYPKD